MNIILGIFESIPIVEFLDHNEGQLLIFERPALFSIITEPDGIPINSTLFLTSFPNNEHFYFMWWVTALPVWDDISLLFYLHSLVIGYKGHLSVYPLTSVCYFECLFSISLHIFIWLRCMEQKLTIAGSNSNQGRKHEK